MSRSWTAIWNLTQTHTHSTAGSNGEAIGQAGGQHAGEESEIANVMETPAVKKRMLIKITHLEIRESEILELSGTRSNMLNLKMFVLSLLFTFLLPFSHFFFFQSSSRYFHHNRPISSYLPYSTKSRKRSS